MEEDSVVMEEILVAEEDTVEVREEEVATVEVITEEIKEEVLAKEEEEVLVRVDSREEEAAPTWAPPPT